MGMYKIVCCLPRLADVLEPQRRGATIDANLVTPYLPTVLSLTDQVNEFLGSVASKPKSTPWTSADSLFSFFIGINDIGNSYYEPGSRSA